MRACLPYMNPPFSRFVKQMNTHITYFIENIVLDNKKSMLANFPYALDLEFHVDVVDVSQSSESVRDRAYRPTLEYTKLKECVKEHRIQSAVL